jgi:hypothetical protein
MMMMMMMMASTMTLLRAFDPQKQPFDVTQDAPAKTLVISDDGGFATDHDGTRHERRTFKSIAPIIHSHPSHSSHRSSFLPFILIIPHFHAAFPRMKAHHQLLGSDGQKIGRTTPLAEAVKWKEDFEVERLKNRSGLWAQGNQLKLKLKPILTSSSSSRVLKKRARSRWGAPSCRADIRVAAPFIVGFVNVI